MEVTDRTKSLFELANPSLAKLSSERYLISYRTFVSWKNEKKYDKISEDMLLEFFTHLSKEKKPSTLWSWYSMLKSVMITEDNVNITNYFKLLEFLKEQSEGYQCKSSKDLTEQQIKEFLSDAPDEIYLAHKAILSLAVAGGCNREELYNLTLKNVQDNGSYLVVKTSSEKRKSRRFTVMGYLYEVYKKYASRRLQSKTPSKRIFISFLKGKFCKSPMGINRIGTVPKEVARYLKLPDADQYRGHFFRRTAPRDSILQIPDAPASLADEDTETAKVTKVAQVPKLNDAVCNQTIVLLLQNQSGTSTPLKSVVSSQSISTPLKSVASSQSINTINKVNPSFDTFILKKDGNKSDASTMTDPLKLVYNFGDAKLEFVCKLGENVESSFFIEKVNEKHGDDLNFLKKTQSQSENSENPITAKGVLTVQSQTNSLVKTPSITAEAQSGDLESTDTPMGGSEQMEYMDIQDVLAENDILDTLDVKKHEIEDVQALPLYSCPECGFTFEEENLLQEHLQTHNESKYWFPELKP